MMNPITTTPLIDAVCDKHRLCKDGKSYPLSEYLELRGHARALEEAVRSSIEVIKTWHNMDGSDDVWHIYYDHAPEMRLIRAALAKTATE